MTSPFERIQENPTRATALVGISHVQFTALVIYVEQHQEEKQQQQELKKKRVNAKGGGRRPKLSKAEGLCLCLFYLRHSPVFEVLGLLFNVSETTANDTFHYWLNVLRELLPASLYEQLNSQGKDWSEFAQELEKYRLLVDSTEQDRERPRDNQEQQKYYSKKNKGHTFKTSVIGMPEGKDIVDVTTGHRGPEADITLFREQQKIFSDEQQFDGDKAYVGGQNMKTPHKKPKNGELTEEQKKWNQEFSSSRIFIEHLMRRIKIARIAQYRFPLKASCYEKVILVICGLVRFRLGTFKPTVKRGQLGLPEPA